MPGQRHQSNKVPRRRIKSQSKSKYSSRNNNNFQYYAPPIQNQHPFQQLNPNKFSFATLTASLAHSHTFHQVAPFLVLFLLPAFFILLYSRVRRMSVVYRLGSGLGSWLWSSSASEKKLGKAKHVRTRAEQVARLEGKAGSDSDGADEGWYPGLVNISGTYCFMNSTIQALASLTYLQPHIDLIHAKAEALDVPTPVIDALKSLFEDLNTPQKSYRAIRPVDIIKALTASSEGRPNSLFYSREHQDAQELFQLLSECIKNELTAVDKEGLRDRGLKGLGLTNGGEEWRKEIGKSVFDGLTANRRSCTVCQYTEAVMHFSLDNWQLAVPHAHSVHLEACLEEYIKLEYLNDCICRNCSIRMTHERLKADLLVMQSIENPSTHKKKKIRELRGMVERVGRAVKEGRIEDDIEGVKMDKVFRVCTKQTMIARPPPVLVLHINRSLHSGYYASKNSVRVIFPEILDLTPYTTSGSLSTVPSASISTPPPLRPRSATPTPGRYAQERERTIYRLASVVCHFGVHSAGHYICYRRKPRGVKVAEGEERWVPPRLVEVEDEEDEKPQVSPFGVKKHAFAGRYAFADPPARPGKGWLRISDDSVREVGIEAVLNEGSGAFMLYYERAVIEPVVSVYKAHGGSTSEETLKPVVKKMGEDDCEVGVGVRGRSEERKGLDSHSEEEAKVKVKVEVKEEEEEVKVEVKEEEEEVKVNGLPIPAPAPIPIPIPGAFDFDRKFGTARIVRNVAAGRRSGSASAATSREGSVISVSPPETSLSVGALPRSPLATKATVNGVPNGIIRMVPKFPLTSSSKSLEESIANEDAMMASAPALLSSPSPPPSSTTSTSPISSPSKKKKKKKRIQSPPPAPHASASPVGLKA